MQVKGVKINGGLRLDTSILSEQQIQSLAKRAGDIVIADVQKKYQEKLAAVVSKTYSDYLLAVANYMGRKGNSTFAISSASSQTTSRWKNQRGGVKKLLGSLGETKNINIAFDVTTPAGSLGSAQQVSISFTSRWQMLAPSTILAKKKGFRNRFWAATGQTQSTIMEELRAIARSNPVRMVKVTRRRIPIQADLRPEKAKPYAKYQMVSALKLKVPKDPAWAQIISESFSSGLTNGNLAPLHGESEEGVTGRPMPLSLYGEVGFTTRSGQKVRRAFIQQMGARAGKVLFEQLQQIKA